MTLSRAQACLDHPGAKAAVKSCDLGSTSAKGSTGKMLRENTLGPTSHVQKTQDDSVRYTNQFQTQLCTLSLLSDSKLLGNQLHVLHIISSDGVVSVQPHVCMPHPTDPPVQVQLLCGAS